MVVDNLGKEMEKKLKTIVINGALSFSVLLVLFLISETYLRIQHNIFTAKYNDRDLCYMASSNPGLRSQSYSLISKGNPWFYIFIPIPLRRSIFGLARPLFCFPRK